jgi:hypothetical protein
MDIYPRVSIHDYANGNVFDDEISGTNSCFGDEGFELAVKWQPCPTTYTLYLPYACNDAVMELTPTLTLISPRQSDLVRNLLLARATSLTTQRPSLYQHPSKLCHKKLDFGSHRLSRQPYPPPQLVSHVPQPGS